MSNILVPVDRTAAAGLAVLLLDPEDRKVVGRELVSSRDLAAARDETWLRGLRAGHLGESPEGLVMRVTPGEAGRDDRLLSFRMELCGPQGSFAGDFSLRCLERVARRGVMKLKKSGHLEDGREVSYCLTSLPPAAAAAAPAATVGQVQRRCSPPVFTRAPLARFIEASRPVPGSSAAPAKEADPPGEDSSLPVFVTSAAWNEAHRIARRGGEKESAGLWCGRLLRDTASTEVFLLADGCLEAEAAEEGEYSILFSAETWRRLDERLELRRRRLDRPHERWLGSVHGHPFGPAPHGLDGRPERCETCHLAGVCRRTSALASTSDEEWHLGVFAGQAWGLLLIWGFTARMEEDWRLHGLADGRLAPRQVLALEEGVDVDKLITVAS